MGKSKKKYKAGDFVDYTNGRSPPIKLTKFGAERLNKSKSKSKSSGGLF